MKFLKAILSLFCFQSPFEHGFHAGEMGLGIEFNNFNGHEATDWLRGHQMGNNHYKQITKS